MKELTKQEMEAILLEHEKAELEVDIDATMATLVPNPHYEIAFLGLAIDGWEGVHQAYQRILRPAQIRPVAAKRRVHAVARNTLIREAHVTFNTSEGERVTGLYMVVMEFDPELKKIAGERMYADPLFGKMMTEQLGEDFAKIPGVSRIRDSAPVIEEHDAYAAAAARGVTITPPV
ncbi:hypothetical protein [Sphingobium sp. EM0848]|uniref:hypothetical protein n=1 Tax=Sphingobium sp. EM0848 TaxID=2743473 RepID=UPI00159C9BEC|nr:hypothetical protein [Sphingobium sp. EM0848]